ncbi:MAG TPA: hypothetical protein VGO09_06665, partial [Flavisolibacter sp.]|nr:hypothetical protein [Flavisolibacter sp.]
MNIINKAFLKAVMLPALFYKKMGINTDHLKAIIITKLTIDDRRPNTFQQTRRNNNKKPVSLATIGTMLICLIIGGVYLFSFSIGTNMVTHLTIYFSMFFFMLSTTLISDFTSVLIDVRDSFIILPKPVSDRTFIAARLIHIFIHLCKLVIPMSLPALFIMIPAYGFTGTFIFLFIVLLVTLFSLFFINAVYIIILKITTPEKFKTIISYVQIVFAIVIYGSYQLIPRMASMLDLDNFDISTHRFIVLYPVYWFAGLWNVLYTLHGNTTELLIAFLGLTAPLVCIFIVIRYLAPSFNNKMAMLSSGSEGPMKATASKNAKTGFSYSLFLSKLFTRSITERMGFLFSWKMTSRSRDFKMKVYPTIGYLLVYVFIMFLNNKHISLEEIQNNEKSEKIFIISALYVTSLLLTMAITQVIYSEKYKAAWIFFISPLSRPGEIICGSVKSAIVKFYLPIIVIITISGTIF